MRRIFVRFRVPHRSNPIRLNRGVEAFEFNACVDGCELPLGGGVVLVAGDLPRRDFGDEFSLVWNAAVETL